MSTEKEPDYAGIAERLADKVHPNSPSTGMRFWDPCVSNVRSAYASCMEARLRSDWETIRLLRQIRHASWCMTGSSGPITRHHDGLVTIAPNECNCGLSAHLNKLLEPFTP